MRGRIPCFIFQERPHAGGATSGLRPRFFLLIRLALAPALALVLLSGCGTPFPDARALRFEAERRSELAEGPLRLGVSTNWAAQYADFSGEGSFDGIDPAFGASLNTRMVYGYIPVMAYIVPGAFIALWPAEEFNWPDSELARWLIGAGLVTGAVIDSVAASSGSAGGMPYLGIPVSPHWRLFPEAGVDWSRHDAPAGDSVDALRWLVGFRLLPREVDRGVKPYLRFGCMFSEMHFDIAQDFTGSGPYASAGVDWRFASKGGRDEPTHVGVFVEAGTAWLRESSGRDAVLFTVQGGLTFRW